MRHFSAVVLAGLVGLFALAAAARPADDPSSLAVSHMNASQSLRFRTPVGWTVDSRPGEPEVTEARGGGLIVRILRRPGELGLDSLHVDCMQSRLAGEMETRPDVDYEYDFLGGTVGARRTLDSAFVVHYDSPIGDERDWRQRNLTIVGGGESVCLVGYVPARVWKRSKEVRKLLNALLGSVEFRPWR